MLDEDINPTVKTFALGYVEDPLPGHQRYQGMLAIPYMRQSFDGSWSVATIRFRRLEGNGPKYLTMPGDKPRIFNTREILKNDDWIAICEGELDAIVATACGVPAVAIPGANVWEKHFSLPFQGFQTVYILPDGDDAGDEFADRVKSELPNGKIIPMEKGEDVNSMVQKYGRDILQRRMGIE